MANPMENVVDRVNQLQQQVQQLNQVREAADPQLRAFKMALNHLPTFNGEGGSFRDHLLAFGDWMELEEVVDVRRRKLALVFSLKGSARNRIRHCGINTTLFNGAATVQVYADILLSIFEPDSERQIARLEFSSYKQAAQEDIGSYISTKYDLFNIAYPSVAGGAEAPVSMLFTAVVQGIHNRTVKSLVVRKQPQDKEQLRSACMEAVSTERFSYLNGFAESTSLDGLASIS